MNNTLYAKIQEEFNHIADTFIEKEIDVLADENLITIQSKYNLYDIQPYFAQLTNDVLAPDTKLTIESEDDFDPETDDLYEYKINFENRRAYLKREHYGDGVFYSTLYEYTAQYHKSFSVYQNKETVKAINLSYLYLKNGLPDQFIECTEYGISLKTYTCENEIIKNYKLEWPNHDHHCIGELTFDTEKKLVMITETASDGRVRVLFDTTAPTKNIEEVLEKIEAFLVENIADQILEKVKIEEPVYCILFEYTMQGPFPPTIAFGITSEVEGNFEDKELYELYNAPDMRYFSENDEPNPINIDFYPVDIQSSYLIANSYGENIPWQNEEACELWEKQIFDTYLRICKRLMHFDFSKSFAKTENFLVMARDFEQCNEEDFYQNMLYYIAKK
ncbi:hypothetical protein DMB65_07935 [Flavobacterium cheongpyeongense]|uniref:Uncharacterized protein n=1 Tax=Flavobacterium cheongpyeongense TaxID=2212651 RepID=A0A2V4C543_9FLAO|nr:hypothetical protein [Flavobacterium cheongpyeongense]PXY41324.1 hypothetical protein DMB65_07935 [Flavobacterium cheongpyeongense]